MISIRKRAGAAITFFFLHSGKYVGAYSVELLSILGTKECLGKVWEEEKLGGYYDNNIVSSSPQPRVERKRRRKVSFALRLSEEIISTSRI